MAAIPAAAEKGLLRIAVSNGYGLLDRDAYELKVFGPDGKDFTARFENEEAVLPYGVYEISVTAMGFRKSTREIWLSQPRASLLFLLDVGDVANYGPDEPRPRIVGRIIGASIPLEDIWVRVFSTRAEKIDIHDGRPDHNGEFVIGTDYFTRTYWLIVFALQDGEKPEVLHAEHIVAPRAGDTHVDIDLAGR